MTANHEKKITFPEVFVTHETLEKGRDCLRWPSPKNQWGMKQSESIHIRLVPKGIRVLWDIIRC